MTKKPQYIIVDDNEADRIMLRALLKPHLQFELLREYSQGKDVLNDTASLSADIAFLDVDMPEMNGLELRKSLSHIEVCVFITSHPEFALEGFELAAFDYIVKPITKVRLDKTIERLHYFFEIKNKAHLLEHSLGSDFVMIKEGTAQLKIPTHTILYLEAYKDYTKVVTTQKSYCVLSNLGKLIQEKTFDTFIRIHKSYAIQKQFIDKISSKEISIQGIALPIGRSYKSNLQALGL
jgi:two-component system LytT family response regulator